MNPIQSIINIQNDYQNNSLNVLFYLSQQDNFKNFITILNFEEQQKLLEGFCKNFVAAYGSEQDLVKPILEKLINLIDYKSMFINIRKYESTVKKDFFVYLLDEYKQLANYTDLFFNHDKKYLLKNINQHNLMPTIIYNTNHINNIEQLVKEGADLNISDHTNKLLSLHVGIKYEKFKKLYELGADPFCETNESSYYKLLTRDVKNTKDRNENNEQILAFINDTLKNGENKENALIQSIKEKNKESFSDLFFDEKRKLREGVDINYQDAKGQTMLHHALEHFYPAIINMLLKKGANPNIIDNDGHSPLFYAFSDSYKDYGDTAAEKTTIHNIMKSISETIDFNTKNKEGKTILKDIADSIRWSRIKTSLNNVIAEDFLQYKTERIPTENPSFPTNLVISRLPKKDELAFYQSLITKDLNGNSFWKSLFELNINNNENQDKEPLGTNDYERKDDFRNYSATYYQLAYAVSVVNEGANIPISEQIRSLIYLSKDSFNSGTRNVNNKEASMMAIIKIAESISSQINNVKNIPEEEIKTINELCNQFIKLYTETQNPFKIMAADLEKKSFNLFSFIEKMSLSLLQNNSLSKKNNFKV